MKDMFLQLTSTIEKEITTYKTIYVPFLNKEKIKLELLTNKNFDDNQINIFNEMTDYYLENKDKEIYKKTNYLCNTEANICICNINADELRKIYDGTNDMKFISFYYK